MTGKTRKPGRPRDQRAGEAIIEATLALLEEDGLGALSVDGIAERAGVSKTTIYRRWDSKEAVVIDAVVSMADTVEIPETGDIRDDLISVLGRLYQFLTDARGGTVFPWLVGEVSCGSEVGRRYAASVILPRRKTLTELLRRAVDRGQLRGDLDLDIAVDMLIGPVMVRRLMGSAHQEAKGWESQVVDGLLSGWGSRPNI